MVSVQARLIFVVLAAASLGPRDCLLRLLVPVGRLLALLRLTLFDRRHLGQVGGQQLGLLLLVALLCNVAFQQLQLQLVKLEAHVRGQLVQSYGVGGVRVAAA